MTPTIVLTLYALLIGVISLVSGAIPFALRFTHKKMELAVSFVAGAMLGVGLLHLLPHAAMARLEALESAGTAGAHGHDLFVPISLWLLAGFLAMFLVERFFCFHHHDALAEEGADTRDAHDHLHHEHHHGHKLTWTGAAIGLTLHSLLEGIALAASVSVDGDGRAAALAGLGTLLVIALHKPLDALTLGTLLVAGGVSPAARRLVNAAFALVVPAGAAIFALGLAGGADFQRELLLSAALAFSAGTFLCISLSDLLPELQFHQHDRVKLSAALLLGLALAWGSAIIEGRTHDHTEHDHENHANHEQGGGATRPGSP